MFRQHWPHACVLAVLAGMPVCAPAFAQDQVVSYDPEFFASARPATARDMIDRLPGFSFDGGDGSRGFSGNAGNVLINGKRPASKNDSLSTVLSRIVADQVERIDVISGGAPGIDMQGKAVVANVIQKLEGATSVVVTAGVYYFNSDRAIPSGQVQFRHTDGVRSYSLGLRRDASFHDEMGGAQITRTDALGNSVFIPQTRYGSGGTVGLNGGIETPFWNGDLSVNASVSQYEFGNGTTFHHAAGDQPFASTARNQRGEVGLNWQRDFGGPILDVVALQRLGTDKSTSIFDQGGTQTRSASLRDTSESIARAALRTPVSDSVTIEGGVEAAYNTLSGESQLSSGGVTVPVPSSQVEVNEKRGEIFGQMTWQMRTDLTLDAGVRAEYSTIAQPGGATPPRSLFYPKPRAALSWAVDPSTQVRLRAERDVGQLNFGDFISSANLTQGHVTAGNPNLLPDNRWQYEAVYERRFWERGAVTVSVLHQQISDILDNKPVVTPTGIFDVRGNIGGGTTTRLSLDATIPTDRLGIPGGLLNLEGDWRRSRITDPVTGMARSFASEDPTSYEASFTQDLESLNSTWSLSYNNGWHHMSYRLGQVNRNYGAPTVNASWTYRPGSDLNLTLSVNHLLDAARRRESVYYAGPRDIAPVSRSETETTYLRPRVYMSMRKTFN